MPIEGSVQKITDLNPLWPRNADIVREGAAHIRNIKRALVEENNREIGIIKLFYGALADIPVGHVICDGQNGTPDMRDRVPVGAGGKYAFDSKGGAATVTLTTAQLPPHTHAMETDGVHGHTLSMDAVPAHSHSSGGAGGHEHYVVHNSWNQRSPEDGYLYGGDHITLAGGPNGSGDEERYRLRGTTSTPNTGKTAPVSDHTHSIGAGGAHTPTGSANNGGGHKHVNKNTGGGEAHDNMPPYLALHFIMKIE